MALPLKVLAGCSRANSARQKSRRALQVVNNVWRALRGRQAWPCRRAERRRARLERSRQDDAVRALAGLQPPAARGEIRFEGRSISRDAAQRRVRAGLVLVPEGRQVFPSSALATTRARRVRELRREPRRPDREDAPPLSTIAGAARPARRPSLRRRVEPWWHTARGHAAPPRGGLTHGPGGERLAHSASPQPNGSPSAGFQYPHAVARKQDGRTAAPRHELLTVQEVDQLAARGDRSKCLGRKCDPQRR